MDGGFRLVVCLLCVIRLILSIYYKYSTPWWDTEASATHIVSNWMYNFANIKTTPIFGGHLITSWDWESVSLIRVVIGAGQRIVYWRLFIATPILLRLVGVSGRCTHIILLDRFIGATEHNGRRLNIRRSTTSHLTIDQQHLAVDLPVNQQRFQF